MVDAANPIVDPVDAVVGDVTGGSVSDALTSTGDSNTGNGDGVVNDLLGSGSGSGGDAGAGGTEGDSPLSPVTGPVGDLLEPVVDVVDTTLDPVTNPVDTVIAPVIDGVEPLTSPTLEVAAPAIDPLDGAVGDLTGGSLDDALSGSGDGLISELLGSGDSGLSDINALGGRLFGLRAKDQPAVQGIAENRSDTQACADGDADGVCDGEDLCLNSPQGSEVLRNGCGLVTTAPLELEGVQFGVDSAELTPESYRVLGFALQFIKASDAAQFIIAGHTDSQGSAEYNKQLSMRRAKAVAAYLIGHGVEPSRLVLKAYGEADPIAEETADDMRLRNRRAVMIFAEKTPSTISAR